MTNEYGLISLIGFLLIGPSVIFLMTGLKKAKDRKKDKAKVYYILTVVYLLISFGSCGAIVYIATNSMAW